MTSSGRANRELIKAINQNLLLNILRREGALSRTQLTEISGLSGGTVSQIITELLQHQWILEVGAGEYTGGRRQVPLKLNPTIGYAIGIKVMENRVVCAVTNFEAHILHYHEATITTDGTPEILCDTLAKIIQAVITSSGFEHHQFLGVGVGIAGVIYAESGVIHYSPFFGWKDVPLAEMLQARIHLTVTVENDVNTLTLSEHLFGAGRHHREVVVVTVGRGIGMGMILNGELYRGFKGGTGELGHIVIDAKRSQQGLDGTLENIASDPAILQAYADQSGKSVPDIKTLANAAINGDEYAEALLSMSGDYIGMAIANAINILAPEMVIISGEGLVAGDYRLTPLLNAMRKHTFNGLLDHVEIVIEPTTDKAWARGAASLVISKVFQAPSVDSATLT